MTARCNAKSFVEDQRGVGCNTVGFGIPHWLRIGGENDPDCDVGWQSIWIGDEQTMDAGRLTRPQTTSSLLQELRPLSA